MQSAIKAAPRGKVTVLGLLKDDTVLRALTTRREMPVEARTRGELREVDTRLAPQNICQQRLHADAGPGAAQNLRRPLEHAHTKPGVLQGDRRKKPGMRTADNDDVF